MQAMIGKIFNLYTQVFYPDGHEGNRFLDRVELTSNKNGIFSGRSLCSGEIVAYDMTGGDINYKEACIDHFFCVAENTQGVEDLCK